MNGHATDDEEMSDETEAFSIVSAREASGARTASRAILRTTTQGPDQSVSVTEQLVESTTTLEVLPGQGRPITMGPTIPPGLPMIRDVDTSTALVPRPTTPNRGGPYGADRSPRGRRLSGAAQDLNDMVPRSELAELMQGLREYQCVV